MMIQPSIDPPYGTFALPWPLERLRRAAGFLPENRFGRLVVSLVRKLCIFGRREPFDVEAFPGIRTRLYPSKNRCEKRAMVGPQLFDREEREALSRALKSSAFDPFVFVDLGANVGLYSLWMVSTARQRGRLTRVLAVEPDPVCGARLKANIAASQASEISHVDCAVGAEIGVGHMVEHGRNRGENTVCADRLTASDGGDGEFDILPINEICARHGVTRVDAMKVDVEGYDYDALAGLFASPNEDILPEMIIVEVGKGTEQPAAVGLCLRHGYTLERRTRLNAILQRIRSDQDSDRAYSVQRTSDE